MTKRIPASSMTARRLVVASALALALAMLALVAAPRGASASNQALNEFTCGLCWIASFGTDGGATPQEILEDCPSCGEGEGENGGEGEGGEPGEEAPEGGEYDDENQECREAEEQDQCVEGGEGEGIVISGCDIAPRCSGTGAESTDTHVEETASTTIRTNETQATGGIRIQG